MRNVQVQVIPAKKPKMSSKSFTPTGKRRVAAYARVSTDSEEQLNSYRSQVDYYTNYIKSRSDWELVSIYTDITEQKRIQCKFRPSHNSISHIRSENMSQRYKNNTILYYT